MQLCKTRICTNAPVYFGVVTKGCHICVSRVVIILLNNWINWGHSRQPENVCAAEFIKISECHYFQYLALKNFKILDLFALSLAFSLKFCWIFVVGFPNWHVSGCQLGEETPVHSPIWLWRLLEPSNLVAPPKKYTFRIGTCIESIFAVDSSFRSAVVAEL